MLAVINPRGNATSFSYDGAGRKVTETDPLGRVTTFTYDAVGNLTRRDNARGQVVTYTYDPVGQRTRAGESSGVVTTWTYDATYQLTREWRSGGSPSFDVTYTYDAAGNRLTQVASGAVTTYTYDAANELLTSTDASGVTTYTYDADGNRTCQDGPSETIYYTWDEDSQLTVVEPPAGKTTLTYRGDGQRVRKETPTATTKFRHDGHRLLEETDGSDDLQRQYTSTLEAWGDLVSEYDGSETAYHLCDALGSTDALVDDDEAATDRYQYRAFGAQSQQGTHASPFTFVGAQNYYRDSDLELYYAGARYYDPAAGRWLSEDPLGLDAGDLNLYRYVQNNPVNATDPSGLEELFGFFKWLAEKAGANRDSVRTLQGLFTHPLDTVREHASVPSIPKLGSSSHAEIAVADSWTMAQLRRSHAELTEDPLNVVNPLSHGNAVYMTAVAFFGSVFQMAPAATRGAYADAELALEDVRGNTDSEYVRLVASSAKGLLFVGEVNTELAHGLTQAGVVAAPTVELLNTAPAQWIVSRPLVQKTTPVVGKGLLRLGQAGTIYSLAEGLAEGDVDARDVAYGILAFGLFDWNDGLPASTGRTASSANGGDSLESLLRANMKRTNPSAFSTAQKGALGEARTSLTMRRAGYEELSARLPGNQGFDGVWIRRGADGSIANIIITESKFSSSGTLQLSNTVMMGRQLSSTWIDGNIRRMLNSADPALVRSGNLLQTNRSMIRAKAAVLDPQGILRFSTH